MTKRVFLPEGDVRITPAEASRISGLTPGGLAKMADAGKLTVSRPGGTHRRYLRSEILALVGEDADALAAEEVAR